MQLKEKNINPSKSAELRRTGASAMAERGSTRTSNSTCTRTTHDRETSPGEKVENDSCRLTGHFRGSTADKGKPAGDKAKTRRERANQIDGSEEGSNRGDNMSQIPKDFIRAAGIPPENEGTLE